MTETSFNRREERVSTALPVHFGSATGIARNVSVSGCFFETSAELNELPALGSSIYFTLETIVASGKMELRCTGEVLRIEPGNSRIGVAVKINESEMVQTQVLPDDDGEPEHDKNISLE